MRNTLKSIKTGLYSCWKPNYPCFFFSFIMMNRKFQRDDKVKASKLGFSIRYLNLNSKNTVDNCWKEKVMLIYDQQPRKMLINLSKQQSRYVGVYLKH